MQAIAKESLFLKQFFWNSVTIIHDKTIQYD